MIKQFIIARSTQKAIIFHVAIKSRAGHFYDIRYSKMLNCTDDEKVKLHNLTLWNIKCCAKINLQEELNARFDVELEPKHIY